jgi:hypothetical protein
MVSGNTPVSGTGVGMPQAHSMRLVRCASTECNGMQRLIFTILECNGMQRLIFTILECNGMQRLILIFPNATE